MLRGVPARHRTGLAVLTVLMFSVVPAFAQLDRGQISGFVKDETGGVIPGATVTATHSQTGAARTVVTDGTGYFVFTSLTPGLYEVAVELAGFKKWVRTGVPMDAACQPGR